MMASAELIDSYIDRAAIKADTDFMLTQLKSVMDAYTSLSSSKVSLSFSDSFKSTTSGLQQMNDAIKQTTAVSQQAAKATENHTQQNNRFRKSTEEVLSAEEALAKAELQEIKNKQDQTKFADALTKERQKAEKQTLAEQKAIERVTNDYLLLNKAYREAAIEAKGYYVTLGANHPVTIQATKNANDMLAILNKAENSVGQFARQANNSRAKFDGLANSFTQVSRELPSLTISVQQFALAISNNLPLVADEIGRAKNEIAALKAEGKDAPTLLQRIGTSIISWQIGLSIGIALLTAYAGKIADWVSGLFSGEVAAKKAAEQQQQLNEKLEKGLDLTEKYYSLTERATGTVNRNLENQIAYARARGESEEKILKLERQLLEERQKLASQRFFATDGEKQLADLEAAFTSAKYAYEDFLKTGQVGGKAVEFGGKEYKEREQQLKTSFDLQGRLYNDQKKIVDEYYNANRDAAIKDAEIQKLLSEKRVSFFATELQYRADILKKFSEQEDFSVKNRSGSRAEAYRLEKEILEGQYQDDLFKARKSEVEKFEVRREYLFKKKKLYEEYENDLVAIRQTNLKRQRELESADIELTKKDLEAKEKAQQEAILKAYQEGVVKRQNLNAINQADEIRALDKMYKDGYLSAKEYQQKRYEIERYYSLKSITDAISDAQKLIAIHKANGQDTTSEERKIAELKKSIDDDLTKKLIDNRELLKQKEIEVSRTVINAVQSIIDNGYERQKNALQDQIDQVDAKKQKEIDAINATVTNEQEKAAKIAVINARAQAEKEQLQKKQREADVKKAQFDKLVAILQVGIETHRNVASISAKAAQAQAEAKLLLANPLTAAYAPIAQAAAAAISAQIPLALAQGAIQAGLIAAQPIPKYKHGTGAHPGGLMWAGDGGKSELIFSPDGNAFTTPSVPTLYNMPAGTIVLPDANKAIEQSFNMMYKGVAPVYSDSHMTDRQIKLLSNKLDAVVNAISGKPVAKVTQTWSGVQTSYENVSREWSYVNRNTQSE